MSNVDLVKYKQVTSCSLLSFKTTTRHCDLYHPLKQQLDEVMKMMSRQRTKECKEEGKENEQSFGFTFSWVLFSSLFSALSLCFFLPLFFTSAFFFPWLWVPSSLTASSSSVGLGFVSLSPLRIHLHLHLTLFSLVKVCFSSGFHMIDKYKRKEPVSLSPSSSPSNSYLYKGKEGKNRDFAPSQERQHPSKEYTWLVCLQGLHKEEQEEWGCKMYSFIDGCIKLCTCFMPSLFLSFFSQTSISRSYFLTFLKIHLILFLSPLFSSLPVSFWSTKLEFDLWTL